MSIGFIKLHRKLTQWEWYSDINTTRLFTHLLLMSNYEPKKWRGIEIGRGEYLTSTVKLPKETGLTRQQIRTSLNRLKSTNEITIKSTSKYSIVKLENYCLYQGKEVADQPTKQPTNKPASNQQLTTTKEVKEIKEDKNKKRSIIPNFVNAELWNGFLEMRKKAKAPPTDLAIKGILTKLGKFEENKGGNANIALENSIENNWKGVFDPRGSSNNQSNYGVNF
jgi:hypothetical protein